MTLHQEGPAAGEARTSTLCRRPPPPCLSWLTLAESGGNSHEDYTASKDCARPRLTGMGYDSRVRRAGCQLLFLCCSVACAEAQPELPLPSLPAAGTVRAPLPYRGISFFGARADKRLIRRAAAMGFNGVTFQTRGVRLQQGDGSWGSFGIIGILAMVASPPDAVAGKGRMSRSVAHTAEGEAFSTAWAPLVRARPEDDRHSPAYSGFQAQARPAGRPVSALAISGRCRLAPTTAVRP